MGYRIDYDVFLGNTIYFFVKFPVCSIKKLCLFPCPVSNHYHSFPDLFIVLFTMVDFLLPLIVQNVGHFDVAAIFRLLRMFRAIRALRALRVLRTIR